MSIISPRLRSSLLLALVALTGCGTNFFVPPATTGPGTTTPSTSASFAYVANLTTSTIAGYALGTGALVAVSGSPYALVLPPTSLVVTPANTFLYVGSIGAIFGYALSSTGQLTALNSGNPLAAASVISLDVSPDGKWLFALDANGVNIDLFSINTSTGALASATGGAFAVTGKGPAVPTFIKASPNGAFVAAAMGTGGVVLFPFNTTTGVFGTPNLLAGGIQTSDNGVAFDNSSAFLFVAQSGVGNGLAVFTIASGGALASVAGSPFPAGTDPYSVLLNAAGTLAYLANRGDGTISGYSVAIGGILTPLSSSPYPSGSLVTSLGRDNTAKYLLAASQGGSSDLTMYSFDPATPGKLNTLTTTATGTDPTGAHAVALTH